MENKVEDRQPRIRVSNSDTYTKLKALKGATGESITILANKAMDLGVELLYYGENKSTKKNEGNNGETIRLLNTINHGVNEDLYTSNILKVIGLTVLNVLTDLAEGKPVKKENIEAGLYSNSIKFIAELEESMLQRLNKKSGKGD